MKEKKKKIVVEGMVVSPVDEEEKSYILLGVLKKLKYYDYTPEYIGKSMVDILEAIYNFNQR